MKQFRTILSAIVLALLLSFEAFAQAAKVSFASREMTLREVFAAVERQTGKPVAYNEDVINLGQKVQTPKGELTLDAALSAVLKGLGMDYSITDNQIVIVKTPAKSRTAAATRTAPKAEKYTGVITDGEGLPLPGAMVVNESTGKYAVADLDGNFEIEAPQGAIIKVNYMGFVDQNFALGDNHSLNIKMESDSQMLDEVVVVGMNNRQTRRSITGAISTIQTKELVQSPVANISNALAGKMPGLITVQYSGEPGADASSLYVRGLGTYGTSTPLVVIDGLPRSKADLDMLDANEIESITILKDASSSSLYGIQGANGVVVVTTRRGSGEGRPKISFTIQQALQQPIRLPKTMSSYEQALYNRSVDFNDGQPMRYNEEVLEIIKSGSDPYQFPNTNWFDVVLKDNSWQQQYNINISGSAGKEHKINYFVSGSYINQGTLLNHEKEFQANYGVKSKYDRYNFRSNIDFQATKMLNIRIDLAGRLENRVGPSQSFPYIFGQITNRLPGTQAIYNPDGTLAAGSALEIPFQPGNPYGLITRSGYYNNASNVMYGTISAKHLLDFITPGLSVQAYFSFENTSNLNRQFSQTFESKWYRGLDAITGEPVYQDYTTDGRLTCGTGSYVERYTYIDVRLNYDRSFGQHNVTAQLLGNRTIKDIQYSEYMYAYQGLSARATYNYAQRYFAEFNLGYNGSENFPKGRRYGLFPSFSLGWVLSDEPWLNNPDWLKILKLRGSYGVVGNDQIGGERFLFITEFGPGGGLGSIFPSGYYFGTTNGGTTAAGGYNETRVGNSYVTWEKAKKLNVGFDLSLFKGNVLNLTIDYFRENRDNILTAAGSVPSYVGIENIAPRNSGKVFNHGFEFEVRFNKQFNRDFSMFANLQGTYAKNKVLENDQPTPAFDYQDLRGYEIGYDLGYHAIGLFQDQAEIDNSPQQKLGPVIPGDVKYQDVNNDGIIDPNDRIPIKCYSVPVFTGGFSIGFNWRGFDFSMMFSGALGGTARLWIYKSSVINLERWTAENKGARIPVAHTTANNDVSSDWNLMKTDYLKLRNVELGYTFPSKWMSKIRITNMRLYLNSQNVAVWDTMWLKDRDPEAAGSGTLPYPLQRIFNIGLRFDI